MHNFFLLLLPLLAAAEDYYQLLGVKKNADNREIRKAFKKLALKLHPDKNDAEDAHEKFLKINRAYEVLKDEETRKKYDMFGDDEESGGKSKQGRNYQSWQYYNSDFGIYDDDEEIVTLDYREFQQSVLHGHTTWFVNFYSPRCGHCHDLAPAWRALARELDGTGIMIGAVNCQEEFGLCRRQGITGYPRLMLYTVSEGTKKYDGARTEEEMLKFLARFIEDRVHTLWSGNLARWRDSEPGAWLLLACAQDACMPTVTRRLVAASLEGLVTMGVIECRHDQELCAEFNHTDGDEEQDSLVYLPEGLAKGGKKIPLSASFYDHKDVSAEVLSHIPELTKLDETAFNEMRRRLDLEAGPGWLVMFNHGDAVSQEYKKLVALLPRIRIGLVDCSASHVVCDELYLMRFPTFAMFKLGGAMEIHYGKPGLQEVATFARLANQAHTMETLTGGDFPDILSDNRAGVFIDFFAPWCPPCMSLLPEFRKASTLIGGQITFGTVDCTLHGRLCQQHGVRAYPTTVFFNGSRPHKYEGGHHAQDLADFVEDILRPVVVPLTGRSFHQKVGAKAEEEIWLVDFYAPWCGPCQELAPEWRALAKLTQSLPFVHVGKVDCTVEQNLCHQMGVSGYPTIRMYPRGSKGSNRYQPYPGNRRDVTSLHNWLQEQIPSAVENITPFTFKHSVLASNSLWLVEFYTPWCGHCTHFAPHYEQVGLSLEGKANVGKVNCERYKQLCSQAEVTGYPTVRIYNRADDFLDYELVRKREVDEIVNLVKNILKEGKIIKKKKIIEKKDEKENKEGKSLRDEL